MTSDGSPAVAREEVTVLLVEDDEGDARLVEDELAERLPRARIERSRTLAEARPRAARLVVPDLLSNAVKFRAAEAPLVRIAATRRERLWELSFADNGKGDGIDPEYVERSPAEPAFASRFRHRGERMTNAEPAPRYPTEPVDHERFGEIVRQIDEFFVGIVRLPPRPR